MWITGGRSAGARLAFALAGLLLVAAPGCNRIAVDAVDAEGPSVLLVTIDTLRADHVGAYGAPADPTPTLDALAREGLLVETAIAPTPLTLPSHASIHTGLTPPRHGVRHNGIHRLPDAAVTLAERFQAAGYATGAVVGAAVLVGRHGLAQGFDHYDDRAFTGRASATGYSERTAGEVTDAALDWLEDVSGPFFLWVHYYDPHGAYRPPEPHASRFASRPYAGEVAYTDHELGRLITALRQRGGWDQTLVLATADHGESLGEHGEATHAYTLYDASLRVPLLLRGPGVPAGARISSVRSPLDVAPTLLALAGLPPIAGVEGRPLLPLSPDAAPADRAVYAETLATRLDHGFAPLFAIRTDAHLYVRAPRPELYDVAHDPAQLDDLLDPKRGAADMPPALVSGLSAQIDGVLAAERESERVALGSEARDQLQALGYMVEASAPPESGIDPKDGLPLLDRFIAAEGLYQYDRLAEAEREALGLLEDLPTSPRLLDLVARIQLAQGKPRQALPHAERAAALVPQSARHREMLGSVRLAAGDVRGAVLDFEAAAEIDPGHAQAVAGRMLRLALGGSLDEADREAESAMALRPGDPEIMALVARHWDHLAQYDRSLAVWRKLLSLEPDNAEAHAGAGLQLVRFGEAQQAREHLDRAGEAARAPRFQFDLAVALAARERFPEARALLIDLAGRYPAWPGPGKVLARIDAR